MEIIFILCLLLKKKVLYYNIIFLIKSFMCMKKTLEDRQNIQRKNIAEVDDTPCNLILKTNLISRMSNMSYEDIFDEFKNILLSASKIKHDTRGKHLIELHKQHDYKNLVSYITNYLLAGERLSTNLKNYTNR